LKQVVSNIKGNKFIDCTFGIGGYTREILTRFPDSSVLSFDLDSETSAAYVKQLKTEFGKRFTFHHGNFRDIKQICQKLNYLDVDSIIYDLGVNSLQFDTPGRGFSFKNFQSEKFEIDMRMDRTNDELNAAQILNNMNEEQLKQMFIEGGEERYASKLAFNICRERGKGFVFKTTDDFSNLVKRVYREKTKKNVCTKSFQALRMCVNDEINSLKSSLKGASDVIRPGGRLCIVSFHSGEDKIVKSLDPKIYMPLDTVIPEEEEVAENVRSRSARLRVFQVNKLLVS
jgi:16S rRNA (cytosine1402-N4)-methyltransferase